jgi:hypothetical protein
MATFSGTYAPTKAITHAPTTDAGATVAFNKNGSCTKHPDILLRKKGTMGFGWKILLPSCPRCQADWEDERQHRRLQQQHQPPAPQQPWVPTPTTGAVQTYVPTPAVEKQVVVKSTPAPAPPPPQRQRLKPPPVSAFLEIGVVGQIQIYSSMPDVSFLGKVLTLLQQNMGSANVAGEACKFLWLFATKTQQNVAVLQQQDGTAAMVEDCVHFYGGTNRNVAYYGPLLLERLA